MEPVDRLVDSDDTVDVIAEDVPGYEFYVWYGVTAPAKTSPGAGPVFVVETVKGTFEVETYPNEAPKTVEHILALVKRNFYNGHRVHRQVPGFVAQFGDPLSRDVSKKHLWGTGGSMYAIGVNEASPLHTHETGAVATAHPGDPRQADSQMYIMLAPRHNLDGDYTVFANIAYGKKGATEAEVVANGVGTPPPSDNR